MTENIYTQLDPKFIQGLTTDEIDDIFITRMLWEYEEFHDFNPYDITWNFIHYPGMDTWEKVNDKAYSIIQKILEKGLATCATFEGKPLTFNELNKHKTEVYDIMDNSNDPFMYSFLFELTPKGREYVAHNYPKHQTLIYEIMQLEENRYKDIEYAKNKDSG